jgi:hypothetical protein
MALLYADEHIHTELVERLRQLGHSVWSVAEAGRAGGTDAQVLADATAEDRAVLTFNRWDFDRLHRRNPSHAGIVSCSPDDDLDGLATRIDDAIQAAGSLAGKHLRVNRPP